MREFFGEWCMLILLRKCQKPPATSRAAGVWGVSFAAIKPSLQMHNVLFQGLDCAEQFPATSRAAGLEWAKFQLQRSR